MKIKPLVLAAVLALSATSVFAENQTFDIPLTGPSPHGTYTTGFDVQHVVSGAFEDTFTFTPAVGGFIKGSLVTTGSLPQTNINFTSGSINGVAFNFGPIGIDESGFTPIAFTAGPVILKLFGIAGPDLAPGSAMAGSYSGTLNITVSAVPEPETYAMMLAGLGLVGFIAKRRKKAESTPRQLAIG